MPPSPARFGIAAFCPTKRSACCATSAGSIVIGVFMVNTGGYSDAALLPRDATVHEHLGDVLAQRLLAQRLREFAEARLRAVPSPFAARRAGGSSGRRAWVRPRGRRGRDVPEALERQGSALRSV